MWQILLIAAVLIALFVLIIGPRNISANRRDSYEYYQRCYSSYRQDKKYYKIFGRKKEEQD